MLGSWHNWWERTVTCLFSTMILSSPFSFKISSWHNHSIAQLKAQKQTPKKHNTRRYQRSVLPAGDTMTQDIMVSATISLDIFRNGSMLWWYQPFCLTPMDVALQGRWVLGFAHSLLLIVGPVAITSRMARPSYSSSDLVECSSIEPTSICKYPVTRKNISFVVLGGVEKIRKTKNQIVEHWHKSPIPRACAACLFLHRRSSSVSASRGSST